MTSRNERRSVLLAALAIGLSFLPGCSRGDGVAVEPEEIELSHCWAGKRVSYAPGEGTPTHEHLEPRLVVVIRGGRLTVEGEDGVAREIELVEGDVSVRDPEVHAIRNTGSTTIVLLEVELPHAPEHSE